MEYQISPRVEEQRDGGEISRVGRVEDKHECGQVNDDRVMESENIKLVKL